MSLILNGTTGISDVDGTAAAPALTGTDTNTGIFFGADIIGFAEGGVECARFNADSQFVAAAGTAALPVITTTGDVNTGIFFPAADTIAFSEGGTEAMRIDSSGNLLVGTSSALSVASKTQVSSAASIAYFYTSSTGSDGCYVDIAGNNKFFEFRKAGVEKGSISTNGTNTTYATSSDYRLKEAIAPMTGALAKVALLKPCTYKWKVDGSDGQGFIAHELQAIVPDCVSREKDAVDEEGNPQYQGIDTSFLVATLTAAIQEQQALITALTTRITALEAA